MLDGRWEDERGGEEWRCARGDTTRWAVSQCLNNHREHDTEKMLRKTYFCMSSSIAGFNFAACCGE